LYNLELLNNNFFFSALQIHLNNIYYISNKIIFLFKKKKKSQHLRSQNKMKRRQTSNQPVLVSENEQPIPKENQILLILKILTG